MTKVKNLFLKIITFLPKMFQSYLKLRAMRYANFFELYHKRPVSMLVGRKGFVSFDKATFTHALGFNVDDTGYMKVLFRLKQTKDKWLFYFYVPHRILVKYHQRQREREKDVFYINFHEKFVRIYFRSILDKVKIYDENLPEQRSARRFNILCSVEEEFAFKGNLRAKKTLTAQRKEFNEILNREMVRSVPTFMCVAAGAKLYSKFFLVSIPKEVFKRKKT